MSLLCFAGPIKFRDLALTSFCRHKDLHRRDGDGMQVIHSCPPYSIYTKENTLIHYFQVLGSIENVQIVEEGSVLIPTKEM